MRFLFQTLIRHGERNGIYSQPRIGIGGVDFDIVDFKPYFPNDRRKLLQQIPTPHFEVYLKVIGLTFCKLFEFCEQR